jgi:hypothetical protein
MQSFSQRKGIKPTRGKAQSDSMDDKLKIRLWNALQVYYWNRSEDMHPLTYEAELRYLYEAIWDDYFRLPLDELDLMRAYRRPFQTGGQRLNSALNIFFRWGH